MFLSFLFILCQFIFGHSTPRSIAARCVNPAPPAVRPPRRRCCRQPPRSSPTHLHRHPTTACPRRVSQDSPASTLKDFHTLSTFNSAIAKKFAKQFLFGLFASFFLIISLRFKTVVVLTSRCLASRYSKPSAILRMPAVLTIRTKPKLFPICVRTCRNLSKTSWPAPMATAATSKLKLVDFLGKNLETCETLRHVIYCTTDI